MEEKITNKNHAFNYDGKRLNITGVKEVAHFEDKEVAVSLHERGLLVRGKSLAVTELNVNTGLLVIDGEVQSIAYTGAMEKTALLKRLFK
ncbi:MAG: YabP/YqfC family sporulation protein [Clostridia bacterium]|nr:YabP/YqfC family sporulation protein [Clostridia bacterium]